MVRLITTALLLAACSGDGDTAPVTTTTSTLATSTTVATTTSGETTVPGLDEGDHELTLESGGGTRRYIVHVPPGLGDAPAPVVMSLHGGGGSATQHQTQIELDAVADREGFIALYPDGNGVTRLHTWNAGPYCCGVAAREDIDDVGFLADVLDDLKSHLVYDATSVVIAGHSNGAMMASRFASERPDLVTAVVAVAAVGAPDQVPASPIPMLQIHSVDDPRALYEGGEGPPFPGTNSTVVHVGAMETLAEWARANECSDVVVESDPVVAESGHTATWTEWQGCSERLVHYRLTGAGHGWPGAEVTSEALVGPVTDVIAASEEVWAFAEAIFDAR